MGLLYGYLWGFSPGILCCATWLHSLLCSCLPGMTLTVCSWYPQEFAVSHRITRRQNKHLLFVKSQEVKPCLLPIWNDREEPSNRVCSFPSPLCYTEGFPAFRQTIFNNSRKLMKWLRVGNDYCLFCFLACYSISCTTWVLCFQDA